MVVGVVRGSLGWFVWGILTKHEVRREICFLGNLKG